MERNNPAAENPMPLAFPAMPPMKPAAPSSCPKQLTNRLRFMSRVIMVRNIRTTPSTSAAMPKLLEAAAELGLSCGLLFGADGGGCVAGTGTRC